MRHDKSRLQVRVPATSANLGPGFDTLGLALTLYNTFTLTRLPFGSETSIEASGHCEGLPLDESNLFYRSLAHLYHLAERPLAPYHINMDVAIPPGRGLGSSATAVVGGLVVANLLMERQFTQADLLEEAVRLEHGNHADNVSAALFGGLVVSVHTNMQSTLAGTPDFPTPAADVVESTQRSAFSTVKLPFPSELRAVLLIPDFEMDTVQGRALMPAQYSKADTVHSVGRVALLLAALQQGDLSLLRTAMEDRLHQPYRAQIFPKMPQLIRAALDAGAHGACLSGGGSTILALASGDREAVAQALNQAARENGISGTVLILDVDHDGAQGAWLE